jgi:hypothetical protein
MRISEFVLGYGSRPTTKFQQTHLLMSIARDQSKLEIGLVKNVWFSQSQALESKKITHRFLHQSHAWRKTGDAAVSAVTVVGRSLSLLTSHQPPANHGRFASATTSSLQLTGDQAISLMGRRERQRYPRLRGALPPERDGADWSGRGAGYQSTLVVRNDACTPTQASTAPMVALGAQQANLPTGRSDPISGRFDPLLGRLDPPQAQIPADWAEINARGRGHPGDVGAAEGSPFAKAVIPSHVPAPALWCMDCIDNVTAALGDTSSARLCCDRTFSDISHSSMTSPADPSSPSRGTYSPQASQ